MVIKMGALHQSLKEKRFHQFMYLVRMNTKLEELDQQLQTPIVTVCQLENLKVACKLCRLLINRGANTRVEDGEGLSILHIASKRNAVNLVKLILNKVSDISLIQQDMYGNTPLHYACAHQDSTTAQLLVNDMVTYRVSLDIRNRLGFTPLLIAASNGRLDTARYLISKCKLSVYIYDSLYFKTANEWLEIYYCWSQDKNVLKSGTEVEKRDSEEVKEIKSLLMPVMTEPPATELIGTWQKSFSAQKQSRVKSGKSSQRILQLTESTPKMVVTRLSAGRPKTAPAIRTTPVHRQRSAKSDNLLSVRKLDCLKQVQTEYPEFEEITVEDIKNSKKELSGVWKSVVTLNSINSDQISQSFRKTIQITWPEPDIEQKINAGKENKTANMFMSLLTKKKSPGDPGSGDEDPNSRLSFRNKFISKLRRGQTEERDTGDVKQSEEEEQSKSAGGSLVNKLLGAKKRLLNRQTAAKTTDVSG